MAYNLQNGGAKWSDRSQSPCIIQEKIKSANFKKMFNKMKIPGNNIY